MKTLLEAFENWLAERIQLALEPLIKRVADLEDHFGNVQTDSDGLTLDARVAALEEAKEELDSDLEGKIDDCVSSWMDNNLDDNVRECVENLNFRVEVSRY